MVSVYIPPQPTSPQLHEFSLFIHLLNNSFPDQKLIVLGDFNLNPFMVDKKIIKDFLNIINELGLHQMVKTDTYLKNPKYGANESLLELILVNDESIFEKIIITTLLVKKFTEIFSKVLFLFYNLMMRRCEIPDKLKTVSVVPIHKKRQTY